MLAKLFATTLALLSTTALAQSPELIEQGRLLFNNETFAGNGRTCATCHPATNNFTIDPAFVRRLPQSDPLFIIQATPELRDLEIRQFLRRSTILENLDTFANPGVMRGVPHTLALGPSTVQGRTGWSGDGSPGTLRDFATGAVRQHFTKTLNRVPGIDFRLPTPDELDAMVAFQLSLGRQQDPILATLPAFNDPVVEEGRALFTGAARSRDGLTRACSGCHTNGGTGDGLFDTGVAKLTNVPACQFGFKVPGDGGLGVAPELNIPAIQLCGGGPNKTVPFRGNGMFNAPPAIEAADTPPFFHNNAVATLEGAVAFYTTDTFNNSPAGGGRAFVLDPDEITAIAAFLRALNSLENIRSSTVFAQRASDPADPAPPKALVEWGMAETTDAIEVLSEGNLFPDAVASLRDALANQRRAIASDPPAADLLALAIDAEADARAAILPGN